MLQHVLDDMDDLVAGMAVLGDPPRVDIDARLGNLASRDAQVVPLDVGALDCGLLRLSYVNPPVVLESTRGNQCADRSDPNPARTSLAKMFGCSHVAKWPPWSTSLK